MLARRRPAGMDEGRDFAAWQQGNRALFAQSKSMGMDCTIGLLNHAARRGARASMVSAITAAFVFAAAPSALALHVGTTPGVIPDTSGNPGDPGPNLLQPRPTLTHGDPGWANAAHTTNNLN